MDLVAIVKERAEGKDLSVLGGSVKFVVDENVVVIDGNSGEISSDDTEATCTISTDADTMQSIMDGSSSPQAAFTVSYTKEQHLEAVSRLYLHFANLKIDELIQEFEESKDKNFQLLQEVDDIKKKKEIDQNTI